MIRRSLLALVTLAVVGGMDAVADVKPHGLFSDNMVLQQKMKVPVWGTADDGEEVTVQLGTRKATATAKDGRWLATLDDLPAGGPYEMTIQGKNTVKLKNVLVGEVWIASGQSNMEWPISRSADPEKTIAGSSNPMIRLYTVPHRVSAQPETDVVGSWKVCGPETSHNFSAVAYHFAKDLQKELNVPIGIIQTTWGGTPAQAWTRLQVLQDKPLLAGTLQRYELAKLNYPNAVKNYETAAAKHKETAAKAKAEGKPAPPAPNRPQNPEVGSHRPAGLYNGMIAPLIPFAFRGAIWYQGESNAGNAFEYRTLFPAMIQNWRDDWGQGDFPFLFVQLAPFLKINKEPMESNWAELREAQLLTTTKLPNTAQAVITDVGAEDDIHPIWKEPVGQRLALAAKALAYGQKVIYSGPTYEGMKVEGNKIILSFQHVGSGLVAQGGPLAGFTIAGEDRKFVNAMAELQDDKVVVWSPSVSKPVAVRFGWANYPVVNLWNKEKLPASPFRTDDFPITTGPK
jgi:sialate O-acetylesterase